MSTNPRSQSTNNRSTKYNLVKLIVIFLQRKHAVRKAEIERHSESVPCMYSHSCTSSTRRCSRLYFPSHDLAAVQSCFTCESVIIRCRIEFLPEFLTTTLMLHELFTGIQMSDLVIHLLSPPSRRVLSEHPQPTSIRDGDIGVFTGKRRTRHHSC